MTFVDMLNKGWTFHHVWGEYHIYHLEQGRWIEVTFLASYRDAHAFIEGQLEKE